jgi:hypothetical protein
MHKKLNKCSKLITKFGKWILRCYTVYLALQNHSRGTQEFPFKIQATVATTTFAEFLAKAGVAYGIHECPYFEGGQSPAR